MGKGLSPLQGTILVMALTNVEAEPWRERPRDCVYLAHVDRMPVFMGPDEIQEPLRRLGHLPRPHYRDDARHIIVTEASSEAEARRIKGEVEAVLPAFTVEIGLLNPTDGQADLYHYEILGWAYDFAAQSKGVWGMYRRDPAGKRFDRAAIGAARYAAAQAAVSKALRRLYARELLNGFWVQPSLWTHLGHYLRDRGLDEARRVREAGRFDRDALAAYLAAPTPPGWGKPGGLTPRPARPGAPAP